MDEFNTPCPKCGGKMWDNRLTKRNPKAPDAKCRDRNCDGVLWPPKGTDHASTPQAAPRHETPLPWEGAPKAPTPTTNFTDASEVSYWNAMQFIVTHVVPVWEAGKIPYTADSINAAAATVMIDKQRRSGR